MRTLLKNLIMDPAQVFAGIETRLTLPMAATVIAIAGALNGAAAILETRNPLWLGAALIVLWKVTSGLLLWILAAAVGYVVAARVMRGIGAFRTTLLALGIAGLVKVFGAIAKGALVTAGRPDSSFLMVFWGWYAVLVVIAIREVYDLHTARAVFAAVLLGFASVLGGALLAPVEWFIYPYLVEDPFPAPGARWDEADLPDRTVQVLLDPGFEGTGRAAEGAADSADPPTGWAFIRGVYLRRPGVFDSFLLSRLDVERRRTGDEAFEGQTSAVIERRGAPFGPPIAWAWAQPVVTQHLVKAYRERLDRTRSAEERAPIEKALADMEDRGKTAFLDAAPGQEIFLSVRVKGEGIQAASAMLYIQEQDPATMQRAFAPAITHPTFDWQTLRVRARLPEKPYVIGVCILLWGRGRLWIDDARLLCEAAERLDEAESAPQELRPDDETGWGVSPGALRE